MILRLLVPFTAPGLQVDPVARSADLNAYVRWWSSVAEVAGSALDVVPTGIEVVSATFTHSSDHVDPEWSSFRTIDRPSNYALHTIELLARIPLDRHLPRDREDGVDAWLVSHWSPLTAAAVLRVYASDVGHVEVEIPVADQILERIRSGDDVEPVLVAMERVAVAVGESISASCWVELLAPLGAWLRDRPGSDRWLLSSAVGSPARTGAHLRAAPSPFAPGRARWVSRAIVLEPADFPDGSDEARGGVVACWLRDVVDAPTTIARCRDDTTQLDISWLSFFVGERAVDHDLLLSRQLDALPGRAAADRLLRPLHPRWEATLVAQYFYAAFDAVQARLSSILTLSVARRRGDRVEATRSALDLAIRDATLLLMQFEDEQRYYSRSVKAHVDDLLLGWDFETTMRRVVVDRLESCEVRLNALSSRVAERNSRLTDVVLQAIGLVTIFDLLLGLAAYGRSVSNDVRLSVYDRSSRFNVAEWFGEASTDTVLLAGVVLSSGFLLLYAALRARS